VTTAPERPRRGRPKAGTDDAVAVAYMEAEVIRLSQAGHSFYAINGQLGITNADRIFRRAVEKGRTRTREDAYALESLRLEGLWALAWEKLESDALPNLADRVIEMCDGGADPDVIRLAITTAFTDTWRGVGVAAGIHEKRSKLDGLGHDARIADARLELDQATVQIWATALVSALGLLDVPTEDKRAVVQRWGEIVAGEAIETADD
jgi:hypothetical protein